MAQREQHERVKRMDRWAEKLLGHKAMVVAILVVIAAASGLAMAGFGGHSSDVSFERSDEASASDVRGAGDASPDDADEPAAKSSSAAEVYVDVDGAVVKPGVYRLKDGARVSQAIDAAGGLTAEADVTGLNRASKITDGQKIYVPTVGEQHTAAAVGGGRRAGRRRRRRRRFHDPWYRVFVWTCEYQYGKCGGAADAFGHRAFYGPVNYRRTDAKRGLCLGR